MMRVSDELEDAGDNKKPSEGFFEFVYEVTVPPKHGDQPILHAFPLLDRLEEELGAGEMRPCQ